MVITEPFYVHILTKVIFIPGRRPDLKRNFIDAVILFIDLQHRIFFCQHFLFSLFGLHILFDKVEKDSIQASIITPAELTQVTPHPSSLLELLIHKITEGILTELLWIPVLFLIHTIAGYGSLIDIVLFGKIAVIHRRLSIDVCCKSTKIIPDVVTALSIIWQQWIWQRQLLYIIPDLFFLDCYLLLCPGNLFTPTSW